MSIVSLPSIAYSQKKISNLSEGQAAKFDGILLSPEAYAELTISAQVNIETLKLQLNSEMVKSEELFKLKLDNEIMKFDIMEKSYSDRLQIKNEYIDQLEKGVTQESWVDQWKYELGFATGLAVTLVSFYVFIEAQNAN
jgi:hypothetical protein